MNYAIIGSRTFIDYDKFKTECDKHLQNISKIISGGAKGADSLAARYAKDNNISLLEIIPEWNKYGNQAGFIRNKLIISACDIVIAFWDNQSKGTKHSIEFAKRLKIKTIIINTSSNGELIDLWQI